jgi:pimeloyl-ACP methyl ester carboxylesterase
MKNTVYWRDHYVVETDADVIEKCLRKTTFTSRDQEWELIFFFQDARAPNVLISPGSGGHAYVFAELAYQTHLLGFNVFVMPKHGGSTINELIVRHVDAAKNISAQFNDRIGVFGEGLGGYVTFYLALAHGPVKSIICQNAPAILTEKQFHDVMMGNTGAAKRRKAFLPILKTLVRIAPNLRLPISLYLDFQELVDSEAANRKVEAPYVAAFRHDPDFDNWYPLKAITSLVTTSPPNPLSGLTIPAMFLVPIRGLFPDYVRDLYRRLPPVPKKLIEVDGSVYWMCSHPTAAATTIGSWFAETL